MKNHISSILATILAAVAVSCTDAGTYEFASLYEGLQFDMPRVERPQIPSRNVCITDFGGVGDGLTLNTKAFADAIDNLVSLGGGRITVPEGMWLSGPITLKSGIELHLEKNAVLMFDPDMDLYQIIDTNFEGQDMQRCISPINAYKVKDIAITGEGIIDGNGQAWRELKMFNCPPTVWKARVASGGVLSNKGDVWFPDEGYKLARENSNGFNKPNDDLVLLWGLAVGNIVESVSIENVKVGGEGTAGSRLFIDGSNFSNYLYNKGTKVRPQTSGVSYWSGK